MASRLPAPGRLGPMRRTVFVFDLDGTLVDSVYQHVLAWQEALEGRGIQLSVWRIHRRMGMSGGLFVGALLRETGQPVDAELVAALQQGHAEAYRRRAGEVRVLPGSRELLARLTEAGVPWAVATSGLETAARPTLELLGVPAGGPGHWASACCRAATAARSWSGPGPTGSTRTRPTCSCTWTRSGSGTRRPPALRRPLPWCPYRGPVRAVERRRLACQKSRSRRRGQDGGRPGAPSSSPPCSPGWRWCCSPPVRSAAPAGRLTQTAARPPSSRSSSRPGTTGATAPTSRGRSVPPPRATPAWTCSAVHLTTGV